VDNNSLRPQDEILAEAAREQNSNLRRLIEGVGSLIAASRELLKRLQPLGGEQHSQRSAEQGKAKAEHSPQATPKL
jgi:hypothetical protein